MVLLIDNYDSFTYMLRDYIMQAGQTCIVVRNDEKTIGEIGEMAFDSIVLSPGPRTPSESGITRDVIKAYWETRPILGICLGHQAIGEFFGSSLAGALKPMHGKTSMIAHTGQQIFENIPAKTEVMRYHSLRLEYVLEDHLTVTANTMEGEIMGIAHVSKKIAGLQFHPESVLTPHGLQMIRNWYNYISA